MKTDDEGFWIDFRLTLLCTSNGLKGRKYLHVTELMSSIYTFIYSFPSRSCQYVLKRKTLSTMPPTCCRTQIWPWGWLWGQTLLGLRSFLPGSSTPCLPREVIQKLQRSLHQHPRYVCPLLQYVVVCAHCNICGCIGKKKILDNFDIFLTFKYFSVDYRKHISNYTCWVANI